MEPATQNMERTEDRIPESVQRDEGTDAVKRRMNLKELRDIYLDIFRFVGLLTSTLWPRPANGRDMLTYGSDFYAVIPFSNQEACDAVVSE